MKYYLSETILKFLVIDYKSQNILEQVFLNKD